MKRPTRSSPPLDQSTPPEGPLPVPAPRATVLLLSGPSGSGKSRLARRLSQQHRWPIVQLDDFYRDGNDPGLPMLRIGIPDWDDADSWDAGAALASLIRLCTCGQTRLPLYDLSTSRATGHTDLVLDGATVVIAEGVFAAHLVTPLRDRDLLMDAICVRHPRWITFARRLVRDLREHRKPPMVLLRRGLMLARQERGIIADQVRLGARPLRPAEAERLLAAAAA